ncbi:membrane protein UL20 [Cercopithecine betaherpesvirus 5]|uniref:Membrane protein UL20 n=1 Tax=Simian cytomegalovirus (strain Colburn) TaxID=50292 RepID=G8XT92_SCMVC|nr:membrane protein UL20 [Cercopithecine betaherpesvirus 5]AEV80385.1 membrane protein UL20 [Cercopithecine betaherpesvirus 5]
MSHESLAARLTACLALCLLAVPLQGTYVYVSVLTRSHGLTWTAIGGVNVTDDTSSLESTYQFNLNNVTTENVSTVTTGNGSATELPTECLTRTDNYVGTIWIFNYDVNQTLDKFWYLGNGYNHSNDSCTSPLVNYLQSMYSIWNDSSTNTSRKDHLSNSEVRCVIPETYSINETVYKYNNTTINTENRRPFHQLFPHLHTCSLFEALAFDELQDYAELSKFWLTIIQSISLIGVVIVGFVIWARFHCCSKTPCVWMEPRHEDCEAACKEVVIEDLKQTDSEGDTAPNSPSEHDSTETTPILSASHKPSSKTPPAVSPKPTTSTGTKKPIVPPKPKPKPKPTMLQFPAPKSASTTPMNIQSPKVFTFNDHDIRKHKEEMGTEDTKPRIIHHTEDRTPPVDSVLTPLLPPPPPAPRRISTSRVPVMIPWDNTQSPAKMSPWKDTCESLPTELEPWEFRPRRWL